MRITFKMAKAEVASIPNANMCADDPRCATLTNRAIRRLVETTSSNLLHRKIRICMTDNCVVTPRGVVAITDAAISRTPIPVKNDWYEMLLNDDGVYIGGNPDGMSVRLQLRDEIPFMRDIVVAGSTLKFYTDRIEDSDAYILVQGYDQYGVKVRTDQNGDGELEDGELVLLSGAGTSFSGTVNWAAGGIAHVTKTTTKGRVLMYAVDPVTSAETLLGVYDDDETMPSYKRYMLTGMTAGSTANPTTLTAMVKLDYKDATTDDEVVLIPSLEAIRLMAEACIRMDNNDFAEGDAISVAAKRYLGYVRDHNTPKEHVAISLRTQGSAYLGRRRIGGMI
jgi:hypothetical protein